MPVNQIIIDKGYEGTIPEINKDIQRQTIPPKPSPSDFPNDKDWKKFAETFATDEDWKKHWIENMSQNQRIQYIESMSR